MISYFLFRPNKFEIFHSWTAFIIFIYLIKSQTKGGKRSACSIATPTKLFFLYSSVIIEAKITWPNYQETGSKTLSLPRFLNEQTTSWFYWTQKVDLWPFQGQHRTPRPVWSCRWIDCCNCSSDLRMPREFVIGPYSLHAHI